MSIFCTYFFRGLGIPFSNLTGAGCWSEQPLEALSGVPTVELKRGEIVVF